MLKKLFPTSSTSLIKSLLKNSGNHKQHVSRNLWSMDADRCLIGNREIVGFGNNGEPTYTDRFDFPFPAIRYKELTPQIEALREKEKGDWRKLSLVERKTLYRYSYCLTFAELHSPTGEWKGVIGLTLMYLGLSLLYYVFVHHKLSYRNMVKPKTYDHEHVYAQMARCINLNMNPIEGLCSHWDHDSNTWISKPQGFENPFEVIDEYKKTNNETDEA